MFVYEYQQHTAQVEVIAGDLRLSVNPVAADGVSSDLGLRLRVRLAWDRVQNSYMPNDAWSEQVLARELGATPPPVQSDDTAGAGDKADRIY